MSRPRRVEEVLAALALALPLAGCSGEPEVQVVKASAVEHGAALFRDPSLVKGTSNRYTCATCHATTGQAPYAILPGVHLAGATERPTYWGKQENDLLRSINHCLYYFMQEDELWTADGVEARAMYAYLESLPNDAPEAQPFTPVYIVDDVPPGDTADGEELYDRACATCHGDAHTGKGRLDASASTLPEQVFDEHPLTEYTEEERRLVFVEKVRHGGFVHYGGQMPPFSSEALSDADLGAILSYLGVP